MTYPTLTLKPGKDKPVRHRHHWIFSGAISHLDSCENGSLAAVKTASGELLGHAYINRNTSITGRMISFGKSDPLEIVRQNIMGAITLRRALFDEQQTNAYRLINSEGDGIPGLIVDKYNDTLVVESSTAGIDALMPIIVEIIKEALKPAGIYERSDAFSRREEKIGTKKGWLFGKEKTDIAILENGLKFLVSLTDGQKTGFFLDQREMRQKVRELSKGKKVLNCFGYTGGFTIAALAGGAIQADTIDISEAAMQQAEKNIALNNFSTDTNQCIAGDVFDYLREEKLPYDIVILDPPAFAKKKTDVVQACRGYKEINRLAMQKMPVGSILCTSSCSYHVDEKLFQTVIFQAASEANRTVRIIGRHTLAPDHPINIFHPEGDYLKSLILYIG